MQISLDKRKLFAYGSTMTTTTELERIKTYSVSELRTVAADDRHAVRDEVVRRHAISARKLAKIQSEVAELEMLAKEVL